MGLLRSSIAVQADEELALLLVGKLSTTVEGNELIPLACQHNPNPGEPSCEHLPHLLGNGKGDILLPRAQDAESTGILASVPGIEHDDIQLPLPWSRTAGERELDEEAAGTAALPPAGENLGAEAEPVA
jgi:hypothetical protein